MGLRDIWARLFGARVEALAFRPGRGGQPYQGRRAAAKPIADAAPPRVLRTRAPNVWQITDAAAPSCDS